MRSDLHMKIQIRPPPLEQGVLDEGAQLVHRNQLAKLLRHTCREKGVHGGNATEEQKDYRDERWMMTENNERTKHDYVQL